MNVKQHPLMEVIARKLSGIESVPRKAQARMVLAACRAARKWHEAEIERLRARAENGAVYCQYCGGEIKEDAE